MSKNFATIEIIINFENKIIIKKPLIFNFRSIIGKELKRISCLFKKRLTSEECIINQTCPYSFYFESPEFNRGNKKPHPYTLFIDFKKGIEINEIKIELVLIGEKAISYFPYLYFSIMKAGERGIFKKRERFIVKDVICNGSSILISHDKLNMDFSSEKWAFNEDTSNGEYKKIKIKFFSC